MQLESPDSALARDTGPADYVRALLNILEDAAAEREQLRDTQSAALNILEDASSERERLYDTHRAAVNILEDFGDEKLHFAGSETAILNILEDFSEEKAHLEQMKTAVFNILEDLAVEKQGLEESQREVLKSEQTVRELNETLERRVALVEVIRQTQTDFIIAEFSAKDWDKVLSNILKLTDSEYGFIGELSYASEGEPYLTSRTTTDVSWNPEPRRMCGEGVPGEFRLDTLRSMFGAVTTTGQLVVVNASPADLPPGGRPEDAPELKTFLGVPLFWNTEFIGEIGLANRPAGYTQELIEYLQPLVTACANLLGACRTDLQRREAERGLRGRTIQMETANKELEAFSYSVSHDLRAPLRHVGGYLELLAEHVQGNLDEKGRHYLDIVLDSTQQMGSLIDDLLAFARTGRTEMRETTVGLVELVKQVQKDLAVDLKERKVVWTLGRLPEVKGDPVLLKQVVANLLGNAIKYTSTRAEVAIEIGCREEGEEWVFFVRDNGVGFDMRYAHKLFGVFQRLHSAEEFEGTGIGLATIRRIIGRHGGRTWAEGKVDEGATFYFSLPREVSRDRSRQQAQGERSTNYVSDRTETNPAG
jgi:signal transduction histidine kinase